MVPIESLLRHDDFIRGLARNLLGRDGRAEDVAQDAWLAAAEGGPSSEAQARGWFGRVVRNRVASLRRKDASARRWQERSEAPPSVPEPGELLDREAMRAHVVEALLALDPIYRDCLVLRFYEGLKPREIARRLDIPVETVRTRTRRGLERMRASLDERCGPRRRWLAALLPLAGGEPTTPSPWPWLLGAACVATALLLGTLLFDAGDPAPTDLVETPADAKGPVLEVRGRGDAGTNDAAAEVQASPPSEPPPWRVGGTLRWAGDRSPAADVPVEARLISGRKTIAVLPATRTGKDGTYVLSLEDVRELSPATWSATTLFLSTPGYRNGRWPPGREIPLRNLKPGQAVQVVPGDFRVWRPENGMGHVKGRLVDPDGNPVIEGRIGLYRGGPGHYELVKQGTLNEIGDFDVPAGAGTYYSGGEGIEQDETLTLVAESRGIGRLVRAGIRVQPKVDQWLGTLRLERSEHTIRVRFEFENGQPVRHAFVLARKGSRREIVEVKHWSGAHTRDGSTATLRTDEEGRLALHSETDGPWCFWMLRARPYEREGMPPPRGPDIEALPGAEERVVIRGGALRVRFVDEAGRPAVGAEWTAMGWRRGRAEASKHALSAVDPTPDRNDLHGLDHEEGPDWNCDDFGHREAGPASSDFGDILILGDVGSSWIVGAFTAGFHRGVGRFEIRAAGEADATLVLRRIAPAQLRIVAELDGEPSDARLRYYLMLQSADDGGMRGWIRGGETLRDLVPGRYRMMLSSDTHHITKSDRYFYLVAGKTTTTKVVIAAGGWLHVDIDAPPSLLAKGSQHAQLEVRPVEGATGLVRNRMTLVRDEERGGILAHMSGAPHRNRMPQRLRPGRYRAKAWVRGFECEPVEFLIHPDQTETIRLRLDEATK